MDLKYGLDSRPPLWELSLFGLQWLAVLVPGIVIAGSVITPLHCADYAAQVIYLQKMSFVAALTLCVQVLWGHRMPLIAGPSTVLLIGVIGSGTASISAIYSSIAAGGAVFALLAVTGMFGRLQRLFTAKVVATVLLLIAFTMMPTILNLMTSGGETGAPGSLTFAFMLIFSMVAAYRFAPPIVRSTLIVWAMIAGSAAYLILFPNAVAAGAPADTPLLAGFFTHLTETPVLEPGVLMSFLFCFLALSVNDLGSIQSLDPLLRPTHMDRRLKRGMTVTGIMNMVSGVLGIIGPVNFSLSPGIITSSGCASRFALLPTAGVLLLLSFCPAAIGLIARVPPVIIGGMLVYVLASQVAAGLVVTFKGKESFDFTDGLVVGLPLLVGTIVAFLPATMVQTLPSALRPILGNGFVIGVVTVLLLEHLVFVSKTSSSAHTLPEEDRPG
jgi:xanthine/uracil permease